MLRYVKRAKQEPDALKDVGGGLLAGTLAQNAGLVGVAGAGKGATKLHGSSGTLGPGGVKKLRKAMNAPVAVTKGTAAISAMGGGAYMTKEIGSATEHYGRGAARAQKASKGQGVIAVRGGKKGPASLIAHEMGHASANTKGMRSKTWQKAIQHGRAAGGVAALVTGGLMGARKGDRSRTRDFVEGGAVGAATNLAGAAPQIFEEGRASVRAVRGLKAIGHSRKGRIMAGLANAAGLSTYVGLSAATGIGSGVLGAGIGRYAKSSKKAS